MSRAFDIDAFLLGNAAIITHSRGKTFDELVEALEALRREYAWVLDADGRAFIQRTLNRSFLMFAVETSQPGEVVDRLYDQCVQQGFVEPHAEASSTIDYVHYCYKGANHEKGLPALRKTRESLCANKAILPQNLPHFLQPIDTWIGYYEESNAQG